MTVQATTHLNFDGEAREALAFYATVFGGGPTLVTSGELAGVTDRARAKDHLGADRLRGRLSHHGL